MKEAELLDIIHQFSDIPISEINSSSKLGADLLFCSFDIMALIAMIEEKISKDIDISCLSSQTTVGDLLAIINNS